MLQSNTLKDLREYLDTDIRMRWNFDEQQTELHKQCFGLRKVMTLAVTALESDIRIIQTNEITDMIALILRDATVTSSWSRDVHYYDDIDMIEHDIDSLTKVLEDTIILLRATNES